MSDHPKEWDELDIDRLLRQLREPEPSEEPESISTQMEQPLEEPDAQPPVPEDGGREKESIPPVPAEEDLEEPEPLLTPADAAPESPEPSDSRDPEVLRWPVPEESLHQPAQEEQREEEEEDAERAPRRFRLPGLAGLFRRQASEELPPEDDVPSGPEEDALPERGDAAVPAENRSEEAVTPEPEVPEERETPPPPAWTEERESPIYAQPAMDERERTAFASGQVVTLRLNRRARPVQERAEEADFSRNLDGDVGPDLLTDLLPPLSRFGVLEEPAPADSGEKERANETPVATPPAPEEPAAPDSESVQEDPLPEETEIETETPAERFTLYFSRPEGPVPAQPELFDQDAPEKETPPASEKPAAPDSESVQEEPLPEETETEMPAERFTLYFSRPEEPVPTQPEPFDQDAPEKETPPAPEEPAAPEPEAGREELPPEETETETETPAERFTLYFSRPEEPAPAQPELFDQDAPEKETPPAPEKPAAPEPEPEREETAEPRPEPTRRIPVPEPVQTDTAPEEALPDGDWEETPRGPSLLGWLKSLFRRPASEEDEEAGPGEEDAPEEKVIPIPNREPGGLRRRLDRMGEMADRFAETMFQGDELVDEEEERAQRIAEQYIPGTDEERPTRPKPRPRKKPKQKKPVRRAPDTSPKQLARSYYSSWKSTKSRLPFQLAVAVLLLACSAVAGGELPFVTVPALAENLRLTGAILAGGLALAVAIGLDTLLDGVVQLFRGRPSLGTLSSLGVLFTLVDAVWYAVPGRDGPLPFCGFAALSLWAMAWGNCRKKRGLYQSCQMAAAVTQPQRLTMDHGKWDNKGVFIKETGGVRGFGSQMQEPDGAQQVYRYAAPVMMAAGLVFGLLAVIGQGTAQHLLWNWSVIFVLTTPLSATMAYGLPYDRLVKRLNRSGVILAGWEGVDSMHGPAGIAITDTDLFPDGYVQFKGIKNFGQVSLEKLTGCTASMIRETDTGLAKIFDDQIRTQGGFYRRVDDLKYSEAGGFSGSIRGDQVLIGSAGYMKVMGIPLQQGYQVKNAVFCVINGQLQGIFSLDYSQPYYIRPALNALIRGGVNPILATRDFNITPQMLHQRFKLPVDRMEYPPVDRRHQLSAKGQPHNDVLAALIYREGLGAYTDAILGGRRLRAVVRLNTAVTVAASAVGALLGFYLTMMNAYASLSLLNTLFFLLMWLIPPLLISGSVNRF